jgi:hypothetical protein
MTDLKQILKQRIFEGFEDLTEYYNTLYTYKELAQPKKNCKHCYGRGYIGLNANDEKIMCKCLDRKGN